MAGDDVYCERRLICLCEGKDLNPRDVLGTLVWVVACMGDWFWQVATGGPTPQHQERGSSRCMQLAGMFVWQVMQGTSCRCRCKYVLQHAKVCVVLNVLSRCNRGPGFEQVHRGFAAAMQSR